MALEAFLAAQLILAKPKLVRGGPWLAKELGKRDWEELKAAAACKGLVELAQLAESLGPQSRLYKHLKDRRFEAAPRHTRASRKKVRLLDVSIKVPHLNVKASKSRSGTRMSGSEKKFHRLGLPKAVLKRPAAKKDSPPFKPCLFPPRLGANLS